MNRKTWHLSKVITFKSSRVINCNVCHALIGKNLSMTTPFCRKIWSCTPLSEFPSDAPVNSFFCNVGDQLSNEIPNAKNSLLEGSINVNPGDLSFLFSLILPQQVIKAMNKFKTSRSFGLDLISSYFLKLGMPILASPLSQIFNISMSQGIFPDDWKA